MSQARAIDSSNALRLLPLPGRDDSGYDAAGRLNGVRNDDKVRGPAASRGVAGQSSQTDNFLTINYDAQITLPQAAANSSVPQQKAANPTSGAALSDEIIGFLLSANEIDTPANQDAFSFSARAGLASYNDAGAGFPRTQNSLFSLAT